MGELIRSTDGMDWLRVRLDRMEEKLDRLLGETESPQGRTINKLTAAYVAEKRGWSDSHQASVRHTLGDFVEFVGNEFLHGEVDRQTVIAWRDRRLQEGVASSTVNKQLSQLFTFFMWAKLEDPDAAPPVNPCVATKLTCDSRGRGAFTGYDVRRIYHSDVWSRTRNGFEAKAAMVWALHTGARKGELASITPHDVDHGLWHVGLSGQGLKTDAAFRLIPLHQRLQGMELPFYADRAARAFTKGIRQMGYGPEYVFHSLRHTFATELKNQQVPEYVIAQLMGHTNSNITTGRYGHDVDLEVLKDAIGRLDWGI